MKRFICIIILALLLCAPAMAEDAALTYCWFSFGGYLPSQTYEVTLEEGIYRLERDDGASCKDRRQVCEDEVQEILNKSCFIQEYHQKRVIHSFSYAALISFQAPL